MSDELESLLKRAGELEVENRLLKSMQAPTGRSDVDLRAENARLRQELDLLRGRSQRRGADAGAGRAAVEPETLTEFNALPPVHRKRLAGRMTPSKRDQLLHRKRRDTNKGAFL